MAGRAGMGLGDLNRLKFEGAGEEGAFEPLKEDLREEGCGMLFSDGPGGGNMEGVELTEVAGVSGAASFAEITGVAVVDQSAGPSLSSSADSTSLVAVAVLSRRRKCGRVFCLPRPSSLTTLDVL